MRVALGVLGFMAAGVSAAGAAGERQPAPVRTPFASREALGIRSVTVTPAVVPAFGRVELTVQASATFENPFDAGDVSVDARIVAPSGKASDVPGFFYRAYRRELREGNEILTPSGAPSWRIRFCPSEPGVHRLAVRLHDRTGTAVARDREFRVRPSSSPGMVRVSGRDSRYFELDNGKPYYPIGANVRGSGARGTFDFDDWMTAYGRAGANCARLSLTSAPFVLQRPGGAAGGLGPGLIDLESAWRLDHVLRSADASGLSVLLTVDSYESLAATGVPGGQWDCSLYNAANGGPLATPEEFWTSTVARGQYLNKLRYVVARYGASPRLVAWELWNEIDRTEGYASAPVREWHAQVRKALEKLDPHRHLVSSSFHQPGGDPALNRQPALDFVQAHVYDSRDPARAVIEAQRALASYRKPLLATAVAADLLRSRAEEDPKGLQVHDPLWASMVSGLAGAAQPLGQDRYVQSHRLYPLFTAASKFAAGIDWPAEKLRGIPARAGWKQAAGRSAPALEIWASAGERTALAWARVEGRTWQRVAEQREAVAAVPPSILTLNGLAPGHWSAEVWDTWSGRMVGTQAVVVPASQVARIELPQVRTDLAVKLRHKGMGMRPAGERRTGRPDGKPGPSRR
jgi:hypothetical protein